MEGGVMAAKVTKTEEEWKKELTPEQYTVLRKKGTETPFTGKLLYNKEEGAYVCAGCGNPVFLSKDKFDSKTGWPSFTKAAEGSVELVPDRSFGMNRIEVRCSRCGGHLGHVFDDGPAPTGKRYCINCAALNFQK
jgi:peptide-methionine (R)-S-oxide reductase